MSNNKKIGKVDNSSRKMKGSKDSNAFAIRPSTAPEAVKSSNLFFYRNMDINSYIHVAVHIRNNEAGNFGLAADTFETETNPMVTLPVHNPTNIKGWKDSAEHEIYRIELKIALEQINKIKNDLESACRLLLTSKYCPGDLRTQIVNHPIYKKYISTGIMEPTDEECTKYGLFKMYPSLEFEYSYENGAELSENTAANVENGSELSADDAATTPTS